MSPQVLLTKRKLKNNSNDSENNNNNVGNKNENKTINNDDKMMKAMIKSIVYLLKFFKTSYL